MAKKSVRELLDLSGSKNSLRAEWRLWCKTIVGAFAVTKRGQRTILGRAGQLLAPELPLEVEAEVAPSLVMMRYNRRA